MAIYRITFVPTGYPRELLLLDVEADRVDYEGRTTTLWLHRIVVAWPRWVVARRVETARVVSIEKLCECVSPSLQ